MSSFIMLELITALMTVSIHIIPKVVTIWSHFNWIEFSESIIILKSFSDVFTTMHSIFSDSNNFSNCSTFFDQIAIFFILFNSDLSVLPLIFLELIIVFWYVFLKLNWILVWFYQIYVGFLQFFFKKLVTA